MSVTSDSTVVFTYCVTSLHRSLRYSRLV